MKNNFKKWGLIVLGGVVVLTILGAVFGEDTPKTAPAKAAETTPAPAKAPVVSAAEKAKIAAEVRAQMDREAKKVRAHDRAVARAEARAKARARAKQRAKIAAFERREPAGSTSTKKTVPSVEGIDHQLAQDTMQAAGFYNLDEVDCTGKGRMLLWDRNWTVESQRPAPGSKASTDATITLCSVKDWEA